MMTPMNTLNTFAQKMMNTINGKLIIMNSSELHEVKQLVEQIDRKFDRLEMQQALPPASPTNESLQQINSLGLSVQKLRKIYSRLFWIVLASSLGLNVANLLISRNPSCAVESSQNAIERDVNSWVSGGVR
ncbi:hypothetical protein IQ235_17535 [Oscillatoriales cyanobacterium LEGE 11467]|uniref:Uncharacterized protein n=1 Tax=Zarconia navalis LEGE 11467 TaxID=1828826 RepID=A0A928VYE6_9CYAN|nr:hypothetical protein [Zarconia navalis]MBE9042574.1 hypothetical protein [Zarconia navalis LEGE 11467]